MRITKLWMIYLIVICLAVCFLFLNSGLDFDYVIPNRLLRLATIVIAGICVAFSSIVFQTLVGNRILTPQLWAMKRFISYGKFCCCSFGERMD